MITNSDDMQRKVVECGGWLIKQSAKLADLLCDGNCELNVRVVANRGVPSMSVTVNNTPVDDLEEIQ